MTSRQLLAAAAALLIVGQAASAQDTFVYAYNQSGMVSANGYPLDDLPGSNSSSKDELWRDLVVQGPNRWLIRGDGKIVENGGDVINLPGDSGWRGIVLDDMGVLYAMSKGGKITKVADAVDEELVNYPGENFDFTDIETDGQTVYVLKSNGSVYRVPEDGPLLKFNDSGDDGNVPTKVWTRLLIHPLDGTLWALRQDGKIRSAAIPVSPADPLDEGTQEADLPYDSGADFIGDQLYYDFTFAEDGSWLALRADGRLYSTAEQVNSIINFPGGPSDGVSETYRSVITRDGDTLVLRDDGGIYQSTSTDEILDLKKSAYQKLVLGSAFPNLDNVDNEPPVGTSMTITAPEGTDITLPVVAVDRDLPSEDLVVEPVADVPLPAGATWDQLTRSIVWPNAGPVGTYKIKITVSDGIDKPVNTTQTIKIKALDVNEAKNAKPVIAKISKATALVAVAYELPILAFDLDGTVPELSLDTSKPPPEGSSFDEMSGKLIWDVPTLQQLGSVSFKFLATDGTATVKKTIKVKLVTSLLGF